MARRSGPSGGTPATVALSAAGICFVTHSYEHDPASTSYGEEMTEATGIAPDRVFKTLVADVDRRLVVGVVPVSGHLDLKALAAALGGKRATMAHPAAAERSSGYVLGGIAPLGQRRPLPTVVDATALDHPTIAVSGGRRGLSLEVAPTDLIELLGATVAAISRS